MKLKSYKVIIAFSAIIVILLSFVLSIFNVDLPLEFIATICSIILSILVVSGFIDETPEDISASEIKNDILSIVDDFKDKIDLNSGKDSNANLCDNLNTENDNTDKVNITNDDENIENPGK